MATNHNVVIAVLATMLVMQALHDSRWFPAQAKPDAPGPKDQQQQPRSKPPTLSDRREASTPTTAVKGAAKEAVGAAPLQKAPVIRARRVDVRNRKPARAVADIPWRVLADVARDDGLDPQAICTKAQPYAGADHMDRVWLAMEAQLERNKASALCEGYNGTRIVLSSFLDAAYLPSFEGWALRLLEATPLRLGCFLIVALDDASATGIGAHGLGDVCFRVGLGNSQGGSPRYTSIQAQSRTKTIMNGFKLDLLRRMAYHDCGHLHVEQDVGLVKSLDPKFFSGEVDLACASFGNDLCLDANGACNLGTLYVGPKAAQFLEFANGWFIHVPGSHSEDQNAFNEALIRYAFNTMDPLRCHGNHSLRHPFVEDDAMDAPYRSLRSKRARFRWHRVQVRPGEDDWRNRMAFQRGCNFTAQASYAYQSFHRATTVADGFNMETFHMVGMTSKERVLRFDEMGYLNIARRRPSIETMMQRGFVTLTKPARTRREVVNLIHIAHRLKRTALLPALQIPMGYCPANVSCLAPASVGVDVPGDILALTPQGVAHQSLLWDDSAYAKIILNSTSHIARSFVENLFRGADRVPEAWRNMSRFEGKLLWYVDNDAAAAVPEQARPAVPRPGVDRKVWLRPPPPGGKRSDYDEAFRRMRAEWVARRQQQSQPPSPKAERRKRALKRKKKATAEVDSTTTPVPPPSMITERRKQTLAPIPPAGGVIADVVRLMPPPSAAPVPSAMNDAAAPGGPMPVGLSMDSPRNTFRPRGLRRTKWGADNDRIRQQRR